MVDTQGSSSERSAFYAEQQEDENSSPFPKSSSCWHGLPANSEEVRRRNTAITGYMSRIGQLYHRLEEEGSSEREMLEKGLKLYEVYWSLNASIVDELLVKAVFAAAADAVLNNLCIEARTLAHLGIRFESDVYKTDARGRDAKRIITDRGLKIYLASKIPCSCLKKLKKDAKHAPKMDRCYECQKEFLRQDMMKCSGCKVARYCSKECQKADWSKCHKDQCQQFAECFQESH